MYGLVKINIEIIRLIIENGIGQTKMNGADISPWIPIKMIGKRYISGVLNFTFETSK